MAPPRERLMANGHSSDLTPSALQSRIEASHAASKQLLAERQQLALASVAGDTTATARIAAIDRERASLEALLITLQDARRALHDKERAVEWRRHLPKAKAIWSYEFRQQAEQWPHRIERLLVGRQSHDLQALANALAELDELERTMAQLAASRALPDHLFRTTYTAGEGHDRADSYKRNAEARKRMEDLVVHELLADTASLRRPAELEQAIADARYRLAVEGANGRAVKAHPRVGGVIGRAEG